jgi:hypothetical protein
MGILIFLFYFLVVDEQSAKKENETQRANEVSAAFDE